MTTEEVKDEGRPEAVRVWGLVGLLTLLGLSVAWQFVHPGPPLEIRLATGSRQGGYYQFGREYAERLAKRGIQLDVIETAGSLDNLTRLQEGGVDIAFVQGGVAAGTETGLVGVAGLYHEPLWLFVRDGIEVASVPDLNGLRVQVGQAGSGTRSIASLLLIANGIDPTVERIGLGDDEAASELFAGSIDAMFLVAAPSAPLVVRLMAEEGSSVHLVDVRRAAAYERRFRFLREVVVPEGVFDLHANRPAHDVRLVAPLATLIASESLHPSVLPVLIEVAQEVHGRGGLFEEEGDFPSPLNLDFPLATSAKRYYKSGPSFLYRWLPFRVAAWADRLKIMLLPLLTLLLPLVKVAPPVYRWRIRSKIFRWYRVLRRIERETEHDGDPDALAKVIAELDRVEGEIVSVSVPPSYMEELYNLQMHVGRVKAAAVERLLEGPPKPTM